MTNRHTGQIGAGGVSTLRPRGHRKAVPAPVAADLAAIAGMEPRAALAAAHGEVDGLSSAEATARLARYGPNTIAREGRPSVLAELTGRAMNPLNALLLTLATISYFLSDARSAIVIALMVVLSIGLGFIQEHRSNDAAAKLATMVRTRASVKRRDGVDHPPTPDTAADEAFFEVPLDQLVPGDIVRLSAGDMIPADVRLLTAKDLFVNQSALTGESMPVEKAARRHAGRDRRSVRPGQHLLHGLQRGQRLRHGGGGAHRRADLLRQAGRQHRRRSAC